jgi:hypothetical protein
MSSILADQNTLVYEPKCGGLSQWVQLYTGAQINLGDLAPYLIYALAFLNRPGSSPDPEDFGATYHTMSHERLQGLIQDRTGNKQRLSANKFRNHKSENLRTKQICSISGTSANVAPCGFSICGLK